MKRILVTAGCVYGRLDDNKLVGNRVRGIWATKFASHLARKDHEVTVLLPDTFDKDKALNLVQLQNLHGGVQVVTHNGFYDYMEKCLNLAPEMDAAVLAAAVVNWIPTDPVKGKMVTKGYQEQDRISIEFELAPRVINWMKTANPNLTLIGCKMLIGANHEDLIDAAYNLLLTARCNIVVANDMAHGLKTKHIVHKDRAVISHKGAFDNLYSDLTDIIEDEYYQTVSVPRHVSIKGEPHWKQQMRESCQRFDAIVDENRDRFMPVGQRVFGALAVRVPDFGWLTSPREKGKMFSSKDAVVVTNLDTAAHQVSVWGIGNKATLNAPLLIRTGEAFEADAVLHLHDEMVAPNVVHAPPGTIRDNNRHIPGPEFNILHHGFIRCLF